MWITVRPGSTGENGPECCCGLWLSTPVRAIQRTPLWRGEQWSGTCRARDSELPALHLSRTRQNQVCRIINRGFRTQVWTAIDFPGSELLGQTELGAVLLAMFGADERHLDASGEVTTRRQEISTVWRPLTLAYG